MPPTTLYWSLIRNFRMSFLCVLRCANWSANLLKLYHTRICSSQSQKDYKHQCDTAMRKANVFHNTVFVIQSQKYLWYCSRSQLLYRVQDPHAQERSIQTGTDAKRGNKDGQEDRRSLSETEPKACSEFNPEKHFWMVIQLPCIHVRQDCTGTWDTMLQSGFFNLCFIFIH